MPENMTELAETQNETQEPASGQVPVPPWEAAGEEFNPERAWAKIQAQRADMDKIQAERDALKAQATEAERAAMSEQERIAADLAEHKNQVEALKAQNARLAFLSDHPDIPQSAHALLKGTTPEELAAEYEGIKALMGEAPKPAGERPREAPLRGGTDPTTPPEPGDWLRAAMARSDEQ